MKVLSLLFTFVLLAGAQEVLTNNSIVKMVKGGLGDELIVTVIQKQPGKYSLTPEDLVKLKQDGVSDKILAAMLSKGAPQSAPVGDVINQSLRKREESAANTQKTIQQALGAAPSKPAAG